jgi:PrtD family type I secretion system ABC transporter
MIRSDKSPLSRALADCRVAFAYIFVVSFFINLLVLVSPLYMFQVYDRVLGSGHLETLVYLTLICCLALALMGALETLRGQALSRVSRWLGRRLGPECLAAGMAATLSGQPVGAQPLRDLSTIRGFFGGPAMLSIIDAPWMPIFLIAMWLMHPLFGVFGVVAAGGICAIAVVNETISRRLLKTAGDLSITEYRKVDAAIRDADVFHAMGMFPHFLTRWSAATDAIDGIQLAAADRGVLVSGFSKFFRSAVQLGILGLGAYLAINRELTPGGMIAAASLLGRALAPIEQSVGTWRSVVAAGSAYDRLRRLLEQMPEEHEWMRLPEPKGRVGCEQVIYVPPGSEKPVLNGISFGIEPGEALGIIGPSASGKSTLCKVLVGSWQPTSGHARIDGSDLCAWSTSQLGPYMGYLPQDVELVSGTVQENIARLAPKPDPEEVVAAAVAAGVHDRIVRLPRGYRTEIGEGGTFLSGGERQRIGLARALYGRPRIIILDEPNASLDAEGEAALMNAIQTAKGWGATVIIVAHQPQILRPADKLLLLRDGRIEMFGPRDEVLERLTRARAPAPRIAAGAA